MSYLKLFYEQLIYSWSKKFSLQLTTLLVLTGSFLVMSLTALFLTNTFSAVTSLGEKFEVSIYLADDDIENNQSKINKLITDSGLFEDVKFVDKEEELKAFKVRMKENMPSFLLEEKSVNPLPSSLSLKIKSKFKNKAGFDKISQFADKALSFVGVDDVSYGEDLAEKYASFLKTFNVFSLGLITFLLISIILVIGNSIRSSISQRKTEIEILELVGATRFYIRMPFILEGAFMGLVSAVFSLLITYFAFTWIAEIANSNMENLLGSLSLSYLNWTICSAICLLGATVGALGAAICINKINSGWAAVNE